MKEIFFTCKFFTELSINELYDITRLRQEVFIVEQTCYYLDADNLDQKCWHVIGKDPEEKIQAYARILPIETAYSDFGSIGRIAVSATYRGTGTGEKLLQYSLDKYYEHIGGIPLKISAQSYLLKFYNKFGFKSTGHEYLEDGIPHTSMIMKK